MSAPVKIDEEKCCRKCLFGVGICTIVCTNGAIKAQQSYRIEALAADERKNPFGRCGPDGKLWTPQN